MRKKNVKLWNHLTTQLKDFKITAGWFENTRYDTNTPVAGIAAVQNYGATIQNPGGTPYFISELAKRAVFVHKNTPFSLNLPLTKPHLIVIPPRPFMDNAKKRITGAEGKKVLFIELYKVFEAKQTMEQAANRLGLWVQSVIQEEIKAITSPPLKTSTIAQRNLKYNTKKKRKSTKPLNATGIMYDTVQNQVTIK